MFHCNIKKSTCTKGNSKTDKMSLVVRRATSQRRSVSHMVQLWSVRKHIMFDVCHHSSGKGEEKRRRNFRGIPPKSNLTGKPSQSSRHETISGLTNKR